MVASKWKLEEKNAALPKQKKLGVLSNEVFIKALFSSGRTYILVSEEDEEATFVEPSHRGKIFGIYAIYDGHDPKLEDVLQPGKNILAAGYCMYGSSCTLA
ncbi:Fructose-1,6-bisphosphatase, cytosolic [Castilleja foliolosa]|uniref:Fructose-1,6-bisphosphatase, cytosolic n=1 Tax=Castilleja foliolosa TaxID=1961234 RepID=A0ABD3E3B9_9LAMI